MKCPSALSCELVIGKLQWQCTGVRVYPRIVKDGFTANNFWFPERSGNVSFSQERSLLGSQESFLNVNRTFPLG